MRHGTKWSAKNVSLKKKSRCIGERRWSKWSAENVSLKNLDMVVREA